LSRITQKKRLLNYFSIFGYIFFINQKHEKHPVFSCLGFIDQ
jgi:hypothetical protein